jgi:hypothetical protein
MSGGMATGRPAHAVSITSNRENKYRMTIAREPV